MLKESIFIAFVTFIMIKTSHLLFIPVCVFFQPLSKKVLLETFDIKSKGDSIKCF